MFRKALQHLQLTQKAVTSLSRCFLKAGCDASSQYCGLNRTLDKKIE